MKKHPQPNMETADEVLGKRIVAFVLDAIILGVLSGVLGIVVGSALVGRGAGPGAAGFMGLVFLALTLVYTFFLEGIFGWTPGKYLLGLVVVSDDGSPCTMLGSVVRNLLRIVDVLPTLYIVGFIAIFISDTGQRVGDMVAGTVVVEQA